MKIGLVLPGFSADEGDWCIPALLDLVRTLARENSVHVFALEYPYRRDNYAVYGAAVHSLNGRNRGKAYAPLLWTSAFAAIRAEHRRGQFDVLHAFWVNKPGLISLLAARTLRIPFVASVAGGELAALRDIEYGGQAHIVERMMIRTVVQGADYVTAGSQYTQQMAQPYRSKVDTLPLGVDTRLFSTGPRKQTKQLRVLNVGSLVPVKGHAALLDAIAGLRRSDICLEIVGAGGRGDELSAQSSALGISPRVRFSGPVPHQLLADKYRRADLFVQSARHESQGMAVLEAAACGTGIVGTPVGVLPELAREGAAVAAHGLQPNQLATAIVDALQKREELGCRARQVAAREFDLETTCNKWTHLYQKTLGSRPT
jgi:glycosyltransferase involved in cell wall biosynthesis